MVYENDEWLKLSKGKLFLTNKTQYFHNHSKEILDFNDGIINKFKSALSSEIEVKTRLKTSGNKTLHGIEAGFLNVQIRELIKNHFTDLKLEVNEKNGVYYFSSNQEKKQIAGFDFALLNSKNNLIKLRNLCFGELKYSDGLKIWKKFLSKNPDLGEFADTLTKAEKHGENIPLLDINEPLILGEIQFGNWGLVYRDFFKLLKANVQTSVDCLVYVVCTGELENLLSSSIVTFDKTVSLLKDFSKVINVPIWVVGLDIKI